MTMPVEEGHGPSQPEPAARAVARAHGAVRTHLPELDWRWLGMRWRCRHCGQRWPCPPYRNALAYLEAWAGVEVERAAAPPRTSLLLELELACLGAVVALSTLLAWWWPW